MECQQRQKGPYSGGRQSRKNRHRMDVTFIKHSEDDVDSQKRCQDEPWLRRQRRLKRLRVSLEGRMNIGWKSHVQDSRLDFCHCVTQSDTFPQIEGDRNGGELALMVYR